MVVELCSENCGISVSTMSPRISFSHDFSQSDVIPVEQTPFRSNSSGLNSSFDFDVCVRESLEQESSSADELFSDGKMLPTEIKKKRMKDQSPPLHPTQMVPHTEAVRENASTSKTTKNNESLKEMKHQQQQHVVNNNDEVDEKQSSSNGTNKSFWGFKRSSSCGSGGYGRSLCPLPLLSRSNSTGSAPTSSVNKRMPLYSKEGPNNVMKQKPHHKHTPTTRPYQKPPLKKIHGSYVHNGVRVNPVINVPSANLFGLGSIFSSNRDKSKKK